MRKYICLEHVMNTFVYTVCARHMFMFTSMIIQYMYTYSHRKSKYKPVIPVYDRYKALKSIRYIDEVYSYQTEEELYNLIKFWKPDIRILGEDYIGDNGKPKPFTGDDLPPKIVYTTRSHGWSTTKLKDLITKQTIKQNPDILKK